MNQDAAWGHIWVLDALFAVLLQHADDVATTTMKDGFSMGFVKNGVSICELFHFGTKPPLLAVNVAISRELWFALLGVARQHDLEFSEFDGNDEAEGAIGDEKQM